MTSGQASRITKREMTECRLDTRNDTTRGEEKTGTHEESVEVEEDRKVKRSDSLFSLLLTITHVNVE